MEIKVRNRRRLKTIEEFRKDLLLAFDTMQVEAYCPLNGNGTVTVDGSEYYPKELVGYKSIEALIDKHRAYQGLSLEAKTIINFVCLADRTVVEKYCSTPKLKQLTAREISKFFRNKWGRARSAKAIREIKRFIKINC
jgi:hypothetical protein